MKFLLLLAWAGAAPAEVWTFWVQPCGFQTARDTGCTGSDAELARWALDAWAKQSGGNLSFKPVDAESNARLLVRWAGGADGLYGEARPIDFRGARGAVVSVLPRMDALGPEIAASARKDPLFRETIVYLTCLHESGHALGLAHTDRFEDIMYSFQFGGDITEYFGRYRRKLHSRDDIKNLSGISPHDLESLKAALQ